MPLICIKTFGPLVAQYAERGHDGSVIWHPVSQRARKGQGSVRALLLLKLLLSTPDRFALSETLLETLWPDATVAQASARLSDAAYLLRGLLRPAGSTLDLLPYLADGVGGYQLAAYPAVWVDADAFLWHIEQALRLTRFGDDALPSWQAAYDLASPGPFLADEPYSEWARERRTLLTGHFRQCVHTLATLYCQRGNVQEAELVLRTYVVSHPSDEDALRPLMELLGEQERYQEALEYYERAVAALREGEEQRELDARTRDVAEYLKTKQIKRERRITDLLSESQAGEPQKNNVLPLTHYAVLDLRARAIIGADNNLMSLWTDDLLAIYTQGIAACRDLYFSGNPHQAEAILPLYCNQTMLLARQPSPLQQSAAGLASLAQQLVCELATDREDFGAAQQTGQQALFYAQLADDVNLQVASLIVLANLGFHRKLSTAALRSYTHAVSLLNEHVTPLLKGRTYAGIAEVFAMRGQLQEAMRAMGLAYEHYPLKPENDPAYPYLRASRYSLYVFGDAQSRLFLGQPKEAEQALIAMERETNDPQIEPITKVDLLYYQAEAHIQKGELEASSTILTEAATLAKDLGSRLYFNKLAASYHNLLKQWPREHLVVGLEDVFQPW